MFWDWVRLILENWRYIISNFTSTFRATCISLKINSKYNYTRSNYNNSCLCPIQWSQVLSHEWRSSWSSADRCCSNYRYIWVINNFIAYLGSIYIKGLKVIKSTFERIRCWTKHLILPILVIILPIISTIPSAKVAEKNKTTVMFIKDTGVNLCKKTNIIIHFLPWRDGPWWPMLVKVNGLLPNGTKPLSAPTVINHLWGSVAFTLCKYPRNSWDIIQQNAFENYTCTFKIVNKD